MYKIRVTSMSLKEHLNQVRTKIALAEKESHRKAGSVLLLAVSKQQPIESMIEAYRLGVTQFGESYLQEAREKMKQLNTLPLCWHFIGPIQSNKTKGIATLFDWVHSISRSKIATALNQFRPAQAEPLQVCLHINLVEEKTKSGISKEEAYDLAGVVTQLPHLRLRGLMTIPPPIDHEKELYSLFSQLKDLKTSMNQKLGIQMDTLSMGMSGDYPIAIKAGATIVRVGRGIFGERQ